MGRSSQRFMNPLNNSNVICKLPVCDVILCHHSSYFPCHLLEVRLLATVILRAPRTCSPEEPPTSSPVRAVASLVRSDVPTVMRPEVVDRYRVVHAEISRGIFIGRNERRHRLSSSKQPRHRQYNHRRGTSQCHRWLRAA